MATLKTGATVYKIYRCRWCEKAGRPGAVRRMTYQVSKFGHLIDPENNQHYCEQDYKCPTCGHETKSAMVNAVLVPDQQCNGKCVNAIGPSCSCSCGGHNHGSGYTYHYEAK